MLMVHHQNYGASLATPPRERVTHRRCDTRGYALLFGDVVQPADIVTGEIAPRHVGGHVWARPPPPRGL